MRFAALVVFLCAFSLSAQLNFQEEGEKERVHFGMSQAEWKAFKESGMTIAELEELVVCGISYNEYQTRPWLSLGVSRKTWIDERCKGLGDADVKAFHDKSPQDFSVILAFLIPGSIHLKKKQYVPGSILLGTSIMSWTAFVLLPGTRTMSGNAEDIDTDQETYEEIPERRPVFVVTAMASSLLSAILAYRMQDSKAPEEAVSLGLTPQYDGLQLSYNKRF
ncbi:MAG: hypothetical protein JNL74_08755 [Fibrobacteres bacterium]|nr:hypothetical protein [Fibrobacterota bacterium]